MLLLNLLEVAKDKENGYGFHLMGSIFLGCGNKILPIDLRFVEIAERLAKNSDIHPDLQDDLFRLTNRHPQKLKF